MLINKDYLNKLLYIIYASHLEQSSYIIWHGLTKFVLSKSQEP